MSDMDEENDETDDETQGPEWYWQTYRVLNEILDVLRLTLEEIKKDLNVASTG